VPAECHAVMEVRSHSEQKLNYYSDSISKVFQKISTSSVVTIEEKKIYPEIEVVISRECDGYFLRNDSPVIQCACKALSFIERSPDCYKSMGGSDANVFNKKGLEVAVVGTGQTAVHSTEEHIKINDLLDGVSLIPRLIEEWTNCWSQKIT
ncbi:M20/M25/M40 family metallo-hydrolase, partial [bacterium]|nr:M20/M25/M40 family metallo-hydrolase [bacterium]